MALGLTGCGLLDVSLPDVTGAVAGEAVAELEAAGFTVVLDGVDTASDDLDLWTVRKQEPAASDVPRGETVALDVVSVLQDARSSCPGGTVGDGGRSISLDMAGEDLWSGDLTYEDVMCILDELEVPDATLNKMGATTSMDGRVEDSWGGLDASWKYHPDDGLDVVVELGR